jgi:U3 small nucleolar RNA-associated protein 22
LFERGSHFHQYQQDNIMAPFPPKRRKLHHDNGEIDSASDTSEPNDNDAAKRPAARSKPAQVIDESALYSGNLYNSSMFKLQSDEMLAQVHLNYEKRMSGVDECLRRLKTLIEAIEDRDMLPVYF